jgi:uncharacterized protein
MPVEVTYPGVYVEEIPSGVRPIGGVDTSITGFAGWARKGPTDRAVRILSWIDYERKFGGLDTRSYLGYSVRHFFDNGGREAFVVRVKHPSKRTAVLKPNESAFEQALLPANRIGGLYHLDRVKLFNLLCVPGETNAATLTALQKFCFDRRAFLIADCPQEATVQTVMNGLTETTGPESINSAIYFPWTLAPDALDNNSPRELPPAGVIAGIYARTDSSRGVWRAPAGIQAEMKGIITLAPGRNPTNADNDTLNKNGINCLRTFPTEGTVVWGSRTMRGGNQHASEWKYVPVRRTALFIEESLYRGLKWVVFEPNDEPLWTKIRLNVETFLFGLFRQGAFQGSTPKDAYFVKCDRSTTTQNDIDLGIVNILVGFAQLKPAEFVIIKLRQIAGQNSV